jgi:Lhr-like helicase
MLTTVRTVIVDEIHAVAQTKRGAHLSLTLERLGRQRRAAVQRIGLSATQKPIEEVARSWWEWEMRDIPDSPQRAAPVFDARPSRRITNCPAPLPPSSSTAGHVRERDINLVMPRRRSRR